MIIGSKFFEEIIIADQSGEVLAIISDDEIIESNSVTVSLDGTGGTE